MKSEAPEKITVSAPLVATVMLLLQENKSRDKSGIRNVLIKK
jgi:hypothetical protein